MSFYVQMWGGRRSIVKEENVDVGGRRIMIKFMKMGGGSRHLPSYVTMQ